MNYTEYRLYVKYRNRALSTHVANVDNPLTWVQGNGPKFVLSDDKYGGVEWLKVVSYTGTVGYEARRGKAIVTLRNEDDHDKENFHLR